MAEQNQNDDYQNKEEDSDMDTSSVSSDEDSTDTDSTYSSDAEETGRVRVVTFKATPKVIPVRCRFSDIISPQIPESPRPVLDCCCRRKAMRHAYRAISLQLLLNRIRQGNTIKNSPSGAGLNYLPEPTLDEIMLMAALEREIACLKALLETLPQTDSSTSDSDEEDV